MGPIVWAVHIISYWIIYHKIVLYVIYMSNCLSCSFSINITSIMCRLGHILYSSSWAFINFFSFQILHKTAGGWFSENTHDTHREDAVHQNKACLSSVSSVLPSSPDSWGRSHLRNRVSSLLPVTPFYPTLALISIATS